MSVTRLSVVCACTLDVFPWRYWSFLAPTGSGKTVLFELAIIRLLNQSSSQVKCIYVAPTKVHRSSYHRITDLLNAAIPCRRCALRSFEIGVLSSKHSVSNVQNDSSLYDLNCNLLWLFLQSVGCELTGDTVQFGKSAWGEARDASVMLVLLFNCVFKNLCVIVYWCWVASQPEKSGTVWLGIGEWFFMVSFCWCSHLLRMFRRADHERILSQIQLFLVDEVGVLRTNVSSKCTRNFL